jgi:hypothetical protein
MKGNFCQEHARLTVSSSTCRAGALTLANRPRMGLIQGQLKGDLRAAAAHLGADAEELRRVVEDHTEHPQRWQGHTSTVARCAAGVGTRRRAIRAAGRRVEVDDRAC